MFTCWFSLPLHINCKTARALPSPLLYSPSLKQCLAWKKHSKLIVEHKQTFRSNFLFQYPTHQRLVNIFWVIYMSQKGIITSITPLPFLFCCPASGVNTKIAFQNLYFTDRIPNRPVDGLTQFIHIWKSGFCHLLAIGLSFSSL